MKELQTLQRKLDRLQSLLLQTQKQIANTNNTLRTLKKRSFLWKSTSKAVFALDKKKGKLIRQIEEISLQIKILSQ